MLAPSQKDVSNVLEQRLLFLSCERAEYSVSESIVTGNRMFLCLVINFGYDLLVAPMNTPSSLPATFFTEPLPSCEQGVPAHDVV